jgi:hypothetical protein
MTIEQLCKDSEPLYVWHVVQLKLIPKSAIALVEPLTVMICFYSPSKDSIETIEFFTGGVMGIQPVGLLSLGLVVSSSCA